MIQAILSHLELDNSLLVPLFKDNWKMVHGSIILGELGVLSSTHITFRKGGIFLTIDPKSKTGEMFTVQTINGKPVDTLLCARNSELYDLDFINKMYSLFTNQLNKK